MTVHHIAKAARHVAGSAHSCTRLGAVRRRSSALRMSVMGAVVRNVAALPAMVFLTALVVLDTVLSRRCQAPWLAAPLAKVFRYCAAGLGGAYLKAGQLLATRPDICSPAFVEELTRLCDRVDRISVDEGLREVTPALRARLTADYAFARGPSDLSGSVAQVYRAVHRESGRAVAVKIVRRSAHRLALHDIRLMRRMVKRLERLCGLSRFGFEAAFAEVARSVILQFNLKREAEAQKRLSEALDGPVTIAAVLEAPSRSVLVMDWLDGMVSPTTLTDELLQRQFAADALRLLYEMIFDHGVVHCDLHPGNLMLAPDGRIALLDFGLTVRLSPVVRGSLARFFLAMITGDAAAGADAVLAAAPSVSLSFRRDRLEADIASLFAGTSRVPVGQFDLIGLARGLIAAQARQGIRQPPEFVMPILALGTLDGRLRRYHPELDFQREALPFVLRAVAAGLDEQEENVDER